MDSLPSWVLKVSVASLGAVAVLALLRRQQLQAKIKETEAGLSQTATPSPPAPASAPAKPKEEVALQAAKASGLEGIAAQKAAAMAVNGQQPGAPDLSIPLEKDIERRLREKYAPSYLDVEDQGGNCGALKVAIVMVSEAFQGKTRVNRQREVQALLREDLDSGRVHALSLMLKTPEEHKKLMEKQGTA
ncbi:SUFE1 [Symbiodinium pilosum]|uniref:SUFE1 protein n=1 Tax=Symbiodinium pilosum TaxID=2952 RepID=A0A812P5L8_SYMPI|nr:SUFE1 [Symbiodinium pilosum]